MTLKNIRSFKPSEIVRSFAEDVKSTGNRTMHMATFYGLNAYDAPVSKKEVCIQCLGGMACTNLLGRDFKNEDMRGTLAYVAYAGDNIRNGAMEALAHNLHNLTRWDEDRIFSAIRKIDVPYIPYTVTVRVKRSLIKAINEIADALEAAKL